MDKEKIIVILSGGLDSTTLVYYLHNEGYEVNCLSFDYGQKHKIELEKAKITCKKLELNHKIINMTFMKDLLGNSSALTSDDVEVPTLEEVIGEAQPITYVPNRNAMMLMIATSYAEAIGANKVCFGAQSHDEYSGYWDTTMSFVEKINSVNNLNRENKIKIVAPFVELSKSDEVIIGNELNVIYENTITCYNGNNCGTCPTCKDRIKAFAVARTVDPLYPRLGWDDLIKKYGNNYDSIELRKSAIKEAIKRNL